MYAPGLLAVLRLVPPVSKPMNLVSLLSSKSLPLQSTKCVRLSQRKSISPPLGGTKLWHLSWHSWLLYNSHYCLHTNYMFGVFRLHLCKPLGLVTTVRFLYLQHLVNDFFTVGWSIVKHHHTAPQFLGYITFGWSPSFVR